MTIVVMVGFPIGAFAVSGSNNFITDAKSGKHATVNASGQLATSASGTVTATPAAPGSMFVSRRGYVILTSNDPFSNLGNFVQADRPGKALVISSITIAPHGTVSSSVDVNLWTTDAGGSGGGFATVTLNPGAQPVTLPFPSGLPLANGHRLFLTATSAVTVDVLANGYYVPAAQCKAPNVCN